MTAESSHSLVKGESLNEQAGNNQTALGYIESPRYVLVLVDIENSMETWAIDEYKLEFV